MAGDLLPSLVPTGCSSRGAHPCPRIVSLSHVGCRGQNGTTQLCLSPGPQGAVWKSYLKYLGILLGLPAMAAIYQLSKKR